LQPKPSTFEIPPSAHAYSRSSAVCLTYSIDRSKQATVTIDFAKSDGNGRYAWSDKVQFQLTRRELAELSAFLFFPWGQMKWVHRAPSGVVKGFDVRVQNGNVLFSIELPDRQIRTPVTPSDQYFFRNLLLARLVEIQPDLSADLHMTSLRRLAEDHQ